MKVAVVYASIHHANTEKVARVMAETMNADMMKVSNLDIKTLYNYDLIGFGSGIYKGSFHRSILELIDRLPTMSDKKAFVFSTSGVGKQEYNRPVVLKLKEKELTMAGDFACRGYDTFGPFKLIGGIAKGRPNDDDLKKAKAFAMNLVITQQ